MSIDKPGDEPAQSLEQTFTWLTGDREYQSNSRSCSRKDTPGSCRCTTEGAVQLVFRLSSHDRANLAWAFPAHARSESRQHCCMEGLAGSIKSQRSFMAGDFDA